MTLKAAAAGLDLGGGKGVIALPAGPPPDPAFHRAALLDFGDLVESLEAPTSPPRTSAPTPPTWP